MITGHEVGAIFIVIETGEVLKRQKLGAELSGGKRVWVKGEVEVRELNSSSYIRFQLLPSPLSTTREKIIQHIPAKPKESPEASRPCASIEIVDERNE